MNTSKASATKILLLGDQISENQLIVDQLSKKYQIIALANQTAISGYIHDKSLNLVVLEIGDPIHQQLSALQMIAQQNPSLKVIVVNSGHSMDVVARAFSYGAADFFRTPVNIPLFCERIDALIHPN